MKWLMALAMAAVGCAWMAQAFAADDEMKPGLVAEVFAIGEAVEDFPTIAADKKPTVKKVDEQVNFDSTTEKWPGTDLTDQFYIRWTGSIQVEKEGKYKFYLESDDGSRLFIDDKEVVNNGGLHGMEEKSGDVELKAGPHAIKIEFFENEGDAGCKLSWEPPGGEKAIVPAKVLSHKASTEK